MSVGHVARAFEEVGIATVSIFVRAFRHIAEEMTLPRTLITRHPMGRPVGAPNDPKGHDRVISAALALLETASHSGTIVQLDEPFRS